MEWLILLLPGQLSFTLRGISFDRETIHVCDRFDYTETPAAKDHKVVTFDLTFVKALLISPQMMISVTVFLSFILIMFILNVTATKKRPSVMEKVSEKEPCKTPSEEKPHGFPRLDSAVDVSQPMLANLEAELEKDSKNLSDSEILKLVDAGKIPSYALEKTLKDFNRAVHIRRILVCMFLYFSLIFEKRDKANLIWLQVNYLWIIMTIPKFWESVVKT